MRPLIILLAMIHLLFTPVAAEDISARTARAFGTQALEEALPESAREAMEGISAEDAEGFGAGAERILLGVLDKGGGLFRQWLGICMQMVAIVLLCAVIRSFGQSSAIRTVELAGVLAVGMCCLDSISGMFTVTVETVDSMSAFSGLLFSVLASATAATGAVGTSSALYGITAALCGMMSRLLQGIFLPGISCYMALMLADHALGDGGLSMAGDILKQIITMGMKLAVILFSAYMSLTGVISGSADSAAVKAAKLGISSVVPVVGSMIADASETLLVSAGLIRSGVGVFGLLGVLAVSIGPFVQTGSGYLMLKCTAAVAASAGEKRISGFISTMAGAMGMVTGLTGVCTVMIMISCVCFMRAGTGG